LENFPSIPDIFPVLIAFPFPSTPFIQAFFAETARVIVEKGDNRFPLLLLSPERCPRSSVVPIPNTFSGRIPVLERENPEATLKNRVRGERNDSSFEINPCEVQLSDG
jgi:hypothetical protein